MHIPDQRIRDALLNLIVYQGDTEFASVEQQRTLLHHAPSDYDLLALMRVMMEEMRHGWQMSYLLCSHFGDEGKREAAKLLERRADEGERLLGSFNELVDNWLDFFTYTQFIDRDGKFQLTMLSTSAFDPLSRSMNPMLKEESFHLGTGNNGLIRIVKAGKMPPEVMQRFFYKWIPTAFDLFGTDNSSSAHWAYVWGLKGRYDERDNQGVPDKAKLNEYSRDLYRQEITKLIERLNMFIPERERWLRVPDTKFNRKIGVYAHQRYTVAGAPEVRALRFPNGESVPTLEDALATIDAALRVFVEVKSLPAEYDDRLLATLDARCAVHGFDHRIVKRLGLARPELPRGVLLASYPLRPLDALEDTGATVVWEDQSLIDGALVETLHGAGYGIYGWTVNEPDDMRRLLALGVDGLCTNVPDAARQIVDTRPA